MLRTMLVPSPVSLPPLTCIGEWWRLLAELGEQGRCPGGILSSVGELRQLQLEQLELAQLELLKLSSL